jgi:hypothetical protein
MNPNANLAFSFFFCTNEKKIIKEKITKRPTLHFMCLDRDTTNKMAVLLGWTT